MIYSLGITVPANTSLALPQCSILKLTNGLVYHLSLYFPPGPSGLLGVRVCDHSSQLWPKNAGEWFAFDDYAVELDESHYVDTPPFEILVYAYNLDTVFQHTARLTLGVVSEDIFIARFVPEVAATQTANALKELKEAAESEKEAEQEASFESAMDEMGVEG